MREGVTPTYAVEVLDVATTAEGLRILAPTYPVRSRRDLQSGAVLTVDLTAPLPDVVGVRVTHHAGTQTKFRRAVRAGAAERAVAGRVRRRRADTHLRR
jgi:alpha-D-xyloside xylohydrolase